MTEEYRRRQRTDRAAQLEHDADVQAALMQHNYVGTEHVLFALLMGEGLAATILSELGVTYEAARAKFDELLNRPHSQEATPGMAEAFDRAHPGWRDLV